MRTQQRTESQCQLIYCPATHFAGVGLHLVHYEIVCGGALRGVTVLARVDQVSSGASFGVPAFHLLICEPCLRVGLPVYMAFNGEFDPGSGRTLAACLTHASRTERPACGYSSGERVSNTWATCPQLWDNSRKRVLIPNIDTVSHGVVLKVFRLGMGPRPISLLVG